jgi:phosphonopyruvate decarboxylase
MIEPEFFFDTLTQAGIEFYSGVPDSLLKDICAYISDNTNVKNHIIAANEGNAFAIGIGYHLATNKIPLIYLQNSGLGNIVNPLLSLADPEVYSVPSLLMIGWRGEPGVKDEPQHKKQGRTTLEMLQTMEVPFHIINPSMSSSEVQNVVSNAVTETKENNRPCALVVKKGSFSSYQLQNTTSLEFPMLREDAIKIVIDNMASEDIVVSTTGVASRELFEYREALGHGHERDFLTVGGMGHASQIALGIALHKPDRQVYCFDGDGAALMHMGAMAINASVACSNFTHIIFNNGAHDSVGGQPTVAHQIDIPAIADAVGYAEVLQVKTADEIHEAMLSLKNVPGPSLLEIKVKKGFRKDLGRPTKTPIENKTDLMRFIR